MAAADSTGHTLLEGNLSPRLLLGCVPRMHARTHARTHVRRVSAVPRACRTEQRR
jgi:hypothetical protein